MNTKQIILIILIIVVFASAMAYSYVGSSNDTAANAPAPAARITSLTDTLDTFTPQNITKIVLLPSDTLTLETKNLTIANFSVIALNQSSYGWSEENSFGLPIGESNFSGYAFTPTNGTLYYIAVVIPPVANSTLLVYRNTQLVFNATRNTGINVDLKIVSTRPTPQSNWSVLFGGLNIKANVPLPSGWEIELVVLAFVGVLMGLGHRRNSTILMYIGLVILGILGFIVIGLLSMIAFVLYGLAYFLVNRHYKKKGLK